MAELRIVGRANVSKTDAILAVTDDDKTNMLAAVRAKSRGCKKAIALINDPTMSALMDNGIDAYINPRSTTSFNFKAYSTWKG